MQRFYQAFKVSESITVEIDSRYKPQIKKGFKQLLQWGVRGLVRYQAGIVLGNITALLIPGLAINIALLIGLLTFLAALSSPGSESASLSVLGLAIGVLSHV
jgi:hypothetical protein